MPSTQLSYPTQVREFTPPWPDPSYRLGGYSASSGKRKAADVALLSTCSLISYGAGTLFSNARILGEASVLLGRPEEARAYYKEALQACDEKIRCRPELALTRLGLAELLLDH